MFGSGVTTLIIPNERMNDIMRIVKWLEESGFWIKDVSQANKSKAKEQKGGFLGVLLCPVVTNLLGNLLTGKGTTRVVEDTIRASEGTVKAGQDF